MSKTFVFDTGGGIRQNHLKVILKVLSVLRTDEPAGTRTQDPRLAKAMPPFFTLAVQSLRETVRVLVRTGRGEFMTKRAVPSHSAHEENKCPSKRRGLWFNCLALARRKGVGVGKFPKGYPCIRAHRLKYTQKK